MKHRMVGAIALAIASLAVASQFSGASAAPGEAKANGGITYLNVIGQQMQLEFNAMGTPAAAKGHIHFRNPVTGVDFQADVTCIGKFGNQAVFQGPTTSGDIQASNIRVVVVDNGEPGTADLVRVTRRPAANGGFTCARPNSGDRPVVHGNAQVMGQDSIQPSTFAPTLPDEQPGDEEL